MTSCFLRSTTKKKPPSSTGPMSPVRNEPSPSRTGGRVGPAPVALHDVVAADRDLADVTPRDRGALLVDHPHLDAVEREADRARLALAVAVVERGDRRGLG